MIDAFLLLLAGVLGTISLLTYIAKWIVKKETKKRFPFLVSADALHRWLCDIISPQPHGKTEYTSLPLEMFENEYKIFDSDAYDRLLDLLAKLKSDGRAGYSIEKRSVWIVMHQRANIDPK